jgi:hypothetical protein
MAKTSGYSGTPLATKLGMKAGTRVHLVNAPKDYRARLEPLPAGVVFGARLSDTTDVIHLFVRRQAELRTRLPVIQKTMRPDAAIWVSWPKKASGVVTDMTEDAIRAIALPMGLVDIKVCAVDEVWSGLKMVIRKELRRG